MAVKTDSNGRLDVHMLIGTEKLCKNLHTFLVENQKHFNSNMDFDIQKLESRWMSASINE